MLHHIYLRSPATNGDWSLVANGRTWNEAVTTAVRLLRAEVPAMSATMASAHSWSARVTHAGLLVWGPMRLQDREPGESWTIALEDK